VAWIGAAGSIGETPGAVLAEGAEDGPRPSPGDTDADIARQLRGLMILRVVTVTSLLISAFAIELLLFPEQTLRPLFRLAGVAYGMVLVHAALYLWLGGRRTLVYVQLIGDALVVTGFVGITGGLDSPMSFLYVVPICVASTLLFRTGGLVLAAGSWIQYTALVTVGPTWLHFGRPIRLWMENEPTRVWYSLVVHLVGMLAVALLSSYLSERVRTQGHELAERRGAVARLKALNENIVESINSGLLTTDLRGRVNFMNRGGSEITGMTPGEVAGQTVERVFGLDAGLLQGIRSQLIAKRRFRFERHYETRDGRRIFLGIAASNLHDRMGRPLGFLFIFQDLTEIRALEQEVRLKERMAALGEMAAGMAHELRNPLAAISGSVQYLKGGLQPSGETLELMDNILRESQRLDQAIRDFLTFARPGRFRPERVDLVKLFEDNIRLLRNSREFRAHHRVETHYAAPHIWCHVDPNRIRQVFWNLANNALKAMPHGGSLFIGIRLVGSGDLVEIVFADQGHGMTEQEQRTYFQPFSGSFGEGTGLGAAIVYRLVMEHHGKITLDARPGQGTRVAIVLPRRSHAAESDRPARLVAPVGG
jgi:two-component system sensor histidine kinase PilS (NtrC family)